MPPLKIRQNHSFTPSPPRPPKGPYIPPISVKTHIDGAVFGELFAGTVGIFIFAVLFWKIGKYIRSLNKHRVLREGKLTTARYAKTWYGWMPLETHERNKRILAKAFRWILDWLSWDSSRMDYSWVWWDPGQEAQQKRQREGKSPSWIPSFLKHYEPRPADEIWNPGSFTQCHGALVDTVDNITERTSTESSMQASRISSLIPGILRALQESEGNWPEDTSGRQSAQQCLTPLEPVNGIRADNHSQELDERMQKGPPIPLQHGCLSVVDNQNTNVLFRNWARSTPDLRQLEGIARSSGKVRKQQDDALLNRSRFFLGTQRITKTSPSASARARIKARRAQLYKHRMWSAKMQLKSSSPGSRKLQHSSGPPGTPFVDLLSSFLSEQTSSEAIPSQPINMNQRNSRSPVDRLSILINQHYQPNANMTHDRTTKFHTAPAIIRQRFNRMPEQAQVSDSTFDFMRRESEKSALQVSMGQSRSISRPNTTLSDQSDGQNDDGLCDWEIRLIDGLNRKLVWIFNETTPGQKPYHFAQLANHWLNRETWLVIDPVSRVPLDCRREWGDPRFNVPYPEPSFGPQRKYPVPIQKRAYMPRVDSWRASVNRQRRASGLRDAVRTVELFENSIEEPPDGHIDPGSWMFPRPPQGFEVSTKQRYGWYEGGTGWQETFEDWQQIPRGYRLRKLLQEGHVNRNWVKGVGSRINKCCRSASLGVFSKDNQRMPTPSLAVS